MNLVDLATRGDKMLKAGRDLQIGKTHWLSERWNRIVIQPSATPQLIIQGIAKVYSLKSRPKEIGWYVSCAAPSASVQVEIRNAKFRATSRLEISSGPAPVLLPWPLDARDIDNDIELSLHFDLPANATAGLLIHRVLDRKNLLQLAKGRGLEIGPGPKPQVLSDKETEVSYVEEKTAEYWSAFYDKSCKYGTADADWSKYVIGKASELPNEDGTIDFIFSSHVFEHLANPLGHLLHWKQKLRQGGVILGVVPDLNGTKDLCASPSSLEQIYAELHQQVWEPKLSHYEQYATLRRQPENAEAMMKSRYSIHVHYYDPTSIARLLSECVENHGFSAYSIVHAQNHKDFHFCLWT